MTDDLNSGNGPMELSASIERENTQIVNYNDEQEIEQPRTIPTKEKEIQKPIKNNLINDQNQNSDSNSKDVIANIKNGIFETQKGNIQPRIIDEDELYNENEEEINNKEKINNGQNFGVTEKKEKIIENNDNRNNNEKNSCKSVPIITKNEMIPEMNLNNKNNNLQLNKIEELLKNLTKENVILKTELQDIKNIHNNMRNSDHLNNSNDYNMLLDKNNILNKDLKKLSLKLSESINKNILLEEELQQLTKSISLKENEIINLSNKNKDLENNLNNLSAKFDEIKDSNEKLVKMIKEIANDNLTKKNEIESNKKFINELQNLKFNDKLIELAEKIKQYQLNEQQHLKIISELKNKNNEYLCENNRNKEILDNMKIQNEIIMTKNNEYFSEISNKNIISENYNKLQYINDTMNQEINQLNYKVNKLGNLVLILQNEKKDLIEEIKKLRNQNNQNEMYYLEKISLLDYCNNNQEKNKEGNNYMQEIKSYRSDNKKLFDLSKSLKDENKILMEESNFYYKLLKKICEGNYINERNIVFQKLINESLNVFEENKKCALKHLKLNDLLNKYNIFINQKVNNKNDICDNSIKDFFDNKNGVNNNIAQIQNEFLANNQKFLLSRERKNQLFLELDKY